MFTTDPREALAIAHERARQLREEITAQRLRVASASRCPLTAYLRRTLARRNAALLTQGSA